VTRQRAVAPARASDGQSGDGAGEDGRPSGAATAIRVHLDELLSKRGMTLTELSVLVDVTVVNLSILKNGRARAIRFSTLARLCEVLQCQPGDLISYEPARRTKPLTDIG
jgi:putative transcriptional regulator